MMCGSTLRAVSTVNINLEKSLARLVTYTHLDQMACMVCDINLYTIIKFSFDIILLRYTVKSITFDTQNYAVIYTHLWKTVRIIYSSLIVCTISAINFDSDPLHVIPQ